MTGLVLILAALVPLGALQSIRWEYGRGVALGGIFFLSDTPQGVALVMIAIAIWLRTSLLLRRIPGLGSRVAPPRQPLPLTIASTLFVAPVASVGALLLGVGSYSLLRHKLIAFLAGFGAFLFIMLSYRESATMQGSIIWAIALLAALKAPLALAIEELRYGARKG